MLSVNHINNNIIDIRSIQIENVCMLKLLKVSLSIKVKPLGDKPLNYTSEKFKTYPLHSTDMRHTLT